MRLYSHLVKNWRAFCPNNKGKLCLFSILFISVFLGFLPIPAYAVELTIILNPEEVRSTATFSIMDDKGEQSGTYYSGVTLQLKQNTWYTLSFSTVIGYTEPEQDRFRLGNDDAQRIYSYVSAGGGSDVSVREMSKWPLWPKQVFNGDLWEPYSFTSIGRDIVSWVTFESMENNAFFWLSDLRIIVRTGELEYARVSPNLRSVGQTYKYIAGNTLKSFPSTLGDILGDLRDHAVIPSYMENWMTLTENDVSQDYPNQDFDNSLFSFSGWMDFLRGEAGFELEDSGHAPLFQCGPRITG